MDKDDYSGAIRKSGLKRTKSRSAILEVLEHSPQPLSAEAVYAELKNKDINMNLSTVYRTLEILTEKNLTEKLTITGENKALYEPSHIGHRHYLVCLDCKKTTAVEGCPLEGYEKKLADETDFQIEGHKLDIYGYCSQCRSKHKE